MNLEEQYFAEGHALGLADGKKSGRAEGRQFGMEKGFQKFAELGRLNGRSTVLSVDAQSTAKHTSSDRLQKHLVKLSELTEIESLPTENSEDGVAEVDDRLREANAKASLVSKLSGKARTRETAKSSNELEDFGGLGRKGNT